MTTTRSQKPIKSWRTFHASICLAADPDQKYIVSRALSLAIEGGGRAVQKILEQVLRALYIEQGDENEVLFADLIFPCHEQDRERALANVGKPRRDAPTDKGPKEGARPQYRNTYRLEEASAEKDELTLLFRIAERFSWLLTRGPNKGQRVEDLDLADAKRSLQQVIMGWLRPTALQEAPTLARAGVCQQVAQQLLSHIGLVEYGRQPMVSFPSLEERTSEALLTEWLQTLLRLEQKIEPFEYRTAHELDPGKYPMDDPKGDHLVNVDPDWLSFVHSPFPSPLPLNFVSANDVAVYKRAVIRMRKPQSRVGKTGRRRKYHSRQTRWRLYVALPIFDGIDPNSELGQLAANPKLGWWKSHCDEFEPLGAWRGRKLNPKKNLLVVPLEYEQEEGDTLGWFEQGLSGVGGRSVGWSLLVQKQKRVGERAAQAQWEIHFATSREVAPVLRPRVLGIHFTLEGVLWALANETGDILEEGTLAGNEVLGQALREKVRLEDLQGQLRWVGDRGSAREIKRRTYEVARVILELAKQKAANIAIERVEWVDKRRGGPEANRIFSMWNYAELAKLLEWLGMEDATDETGDNGSIFTLRRVSDYLIRYTCPQCGACRQAKQTSENAATWLEGNVLQCRRCGFEGEVSDRLKTQLVARLGAERLHERRTST